jgi:hypothetical protein
MRACNASPHDHWGFPCQDSPCLRIPNEPPPIIFGHEEEYGEEEYGPYLCEGCFDRMTATVLAAQESPTGQEMALCRLCCTRRGRWNSCMP